MIFFDNDVFKLSKNLNVTTINYGLTDISILDNFYDDLDAVNCEIEKLPITLVGGLYKPDNGKKYIDGRKTYIQNMRGTELPYLVNDQLKKVVSEITKVDLSNIEVNEKLLINCFKELVNFPKKTHYYSAHRDTFNHSNQVSQLAIVVFLNKFYEDGEGINFYDFPKKDWNEYKEKPFIRKDELDVKYFLQAKPNRAVLFDSLIYHGQVNFSDQFVNELRLTQVIFFPIF